MTPTSNNDTKQPPERQPDPDRHRRRPARARARLLALAAALAIPVAAAAPGETLAQGVPTPRPNTSFPRPNTSFPRPNVGFPTPGMGGAIGGGAPPFIPVPGPSVYWGGGGAVYNPPIVTGFGPWGITAWSPPAIVMSPFVAPVPARVAEPYGFGLGVVDALPALPAAPTPPPNAADFGANRANAAEARREAERRAADAAPALREAERQRLEQRYRDLLARGDRLFRAGMFPQATQRYREAFRANPESGDAPARLMQIELARGDYPEAFKWLNVAAAAGAAWLARAANVERAYGEPGDLDKILDGLEAHAQASPEDREVWTLLGAQYYLSGRVEKARDVFARLNDRKPDSTLQPFFEVLGVGKTTTQTQTQPQPDKRD